MTSRPPALADEFLVDLRLAHAAPDLLGAEEPAEYRRTGLAAFWASLKILVTCFKEAPEIASRRRRQLAAGRAGSGS